ncbi:MAG: M48 family metallopeptidase [Acidobacteria bacterium]|nr:M48 family metallopeptidase [Acidobacteriota bacterium]
MPKKLVLLAIALLHLSCATRQPGDPLKPGYNSFSKEQDIEVGREAAAEIRKQVDIVENQELQRYIRELGARLAGRPEAEDYPYEFTLINEGSINAFALPGGPIFVHSGLLAAADTEGQLVGVLAHEIAHVALRHGTSQASKAQMVQLPAVLAGAVLGQESILAQAGQIGLGLGLNALFMKYSRSAEKQADALGTHIMAGAGYNPVEMANFFQKLEAQGGSRPPALLSSHPSPGNRVILVRAEMEALPPGNYAYASGSFPNAKRQVAQLPAPKKQPQQQVAAAAGVAPPSAPTAGFQRINGSTFSLEYPTAWRTYGAQSSSTLTIAPESGIVRTRGGSGGIGYGAVVSYYQPRYRKDLLNATWELLQQLQEINPNLRAAVQPRQVTVAGSEGLIVGLTGPSPYGGSEKDMLLTVSRPQGVFYMLFIAPENQYGRLQSTFDRMAGSIRFR